MVELFWTICIVYAISFWLIHCTFDFILMPSLLRKNLGDFIICRSFRLQIYEYHVCFIEPMCEVCPISFVYNLKKINEVILFFVDLHALIGRMYEVCSIICPHGFVICLEWLLCSHSCYYHHAIRIRSLAPHSFIHVNLI